MEEAEQGKSLPRLGLVATDEVRIAGLRAVLGDHSGRELVLLSEPGALETIGLDLVLVDSSATDHLLELLTSFRRLRPKIRLLVIGGENEPGFIEDAITAGARGVLSVTASAEEVCMAVEVVSDGSVWAPRRILSRLLDRANDTPPPAAVEVHLTARELEVLELLLLGLSNREIAHALDVEQATVKAHLGRLMRKAGVTNRTALGVHAIEARWVQPATPRSGLTSKPREQGST
jgi:DNA-binding NarL/FixJ family response regulator